MMICDDDTAYYIALPYKTRGFRPKIRSRVRSNNAIFGPHLLPVRSVWPLYQGTNMPCQWRRQDLQFGG